MASAWSACRELLRGTPWGFVSGLAVLGVAADAFAAGGRGPDTALRLLAVAAGHAMLLLTAVRWSGGRASLRFALVLVALVVQGAVAAALHPLGALAWVAVPVWLWASVSSDQRDALGLTAPTVPALALGILSGVFLGAHLLVTASLTLGYRPALVPVVPILRALLYDVGVQVIATELFFRGALFNRAQRRWCFPAAAALSTGACLLRYVADPLLPKSVAIIAGMVFYVTLLSLSNAWLFWRYGTIVPGLAAALIFFTSYRLLGVE